MKNTGKKTRGRGMRPQLNKVASVGTFEWHFSTDRVTVSSGLEKMFGMEEGKFGGRYTDWVRCLHPDDRSHAEAIMRRVAQEGGETLDLEFRITWPGGGIHWIAAKGSVMNDDSGVRVSMVGITIDITARKKLEEAIYG